MVENVWNFVEIIEGRGYGVGRKGGITEQGVLPKAKVFVRFELTLCLLVNCVTFVIERVENDVESAMTSQIYLRRSTIWF